MDSSKIFSTLKGAAGFPFLENDLAVRLGVPREHLASHRTLALGAGVDFTIHKRRVCYSPFGVKKIAAALGLQSADLAWLPEADPTEKTPAAPPSVPVVTLRMLPRKTVNPFIVLAADADGGVCRVRVKNKVNFRPGMVLRCEHVAADLYTLNGNCPRFPGKY